MALTPVQDNRPTTASRGCTTALWVQHAPKPTPYSKHWCYWLQLCALTLQFTYMSDFGTWIILQLRRQQANRSAAPQPAHASAASPQNWLQLVPSQPLVSWSSLLELIRFLGHSRLNPWPQPASSSYLQLHYQTATQNRNSN